MRIRIVAVIIVLCCSFKITRSQETDPREVNALQALRRGLTDRMSNLNNWRRGDPCKANWTGILCFNATAEDGYLHVRELQLLNMNLSGTLVPELGQLSRMEILDVMWNKITGSIPKEIGSIASLELLLLNGNELSGSLPEEIGKLSRLDRIQIDQNQISGPLPKSFANLTKAKHFHMNNNSISGQIPPELSQLPNLVHLLLDNNNLSGSIPPELSLLPNLLILQLDNNNFSGTSIPPSFKNMTKLLKLSLRNCSLQGAIPDLSEVPQLGYLDLSLNQLDGSIPTKKLSSNITTIDLAYNKLTGSIPSNFSGLPFLQKLSLGNNSLTGEIPSGIWQNGGSLTSRSLILDFQNNVLTNISGVVQLPANVTIRLRGNPLCTRANQFNITQFCGSQIEEQTPVISTNSTDDCPPQACPTEEFYEYNRLSPVRCLCAAPVRVGYRLKSPGFSDFRPYVAAFDIYLTSGLNLSIYQLTVDSFIWEEGPRLRMYLKFFPINSSTFKTSEILRVRKMFTEWNIPDSDIFGPYELLNFTLLGPYENVIISESEQSKLKRGILAAIILGIVAGVVTLTAAILIIILRRKSRYFQAASKRRHVSRLQLKIEGVKDFTFGEMSLATNNFSDTTIVGQGGYGKVYKGILGDGTVVAIKRAEEGSMQGSKEFFTEIELLSRLHHRNLVSLIGYCDEKDEQMLVYEFMSNGSLRDHLSAKSKESLSFSMRLRVAIGSARGILYLHTEADPPIIHRDIKASNILLDSKLTAKVSDFGLSRLAPVPDVEGSGPGHVSTVVKGTPGYLDPEYFLTHKLTDKSDVYSLGVVFLELLTGMQPISHGKNLVREVNMASQSGIMHSVVDSRMGSYSWECVERFFSLALSCSQDETDDRPSMSDVVRELENIKLMVPEADATPSVYMSSDISKDATTPSSSFPNSNPFLSMDVIGSDLQSGAMPTVIPR